MNLKKLYNILYTEGYHKENLNIGLNNVDYLTKNYEFESILDVGCSQGLAVQSYQKKGKQAKGIDISNVAISNGKKMGIKGCKPGDVIEIPFADKSFDAVVSSDVLEHLNPEDIPLAISEIIRVTKKYLFLQISKGIEGNREWIELIKEKYKEYEYLDNLHISVFSRDVWKNFFEETGKVKFIGSWKKILLFELI